MAEPLAIDKVEVLGVATQLPEVKRCYVEGVTIRCPCPTCGYVHEVDLGDDYIPGALDPTVYFSCWPDEEDKGCGAEWQVNLDVAIHFKPRSGEQSRVGCAKCQGYGKVPGPFTEERTQACPACHPEAY